MKAISVSAAVLPRFARATARGVGLGNGYVDFGDYVLAATPPGRPRMPNGIETTVRITRGASVSFGDGALRVNGDVVEAGAVWDPVPSVRVMPRAVSHPRADLESHAGRGPGLTPAGDDVLTGYVAGLVLFHGRRDEAAAIAHRAAAVTTGLSATLLDHASRGELPEPAHAYLEHGDAAALDGFGHSSGRCLRLGLMLAAGRPQVLADPADVDLDLERVDGRP